MNDSSCLAEDDLLQDFEARQCVHGACETASGWPEGVLLVQPCRLCHQPAPLRNSHIVTEALYEALYNDKGHLMAISGLGNKGWKPLQQGLKERLFCEVCEQRFNEQFEKPFIQWWRDQSGPENWSDGERRLIHVEYAPFKLFHLSVLYRADASSLPTYREVSLGAHHRERIRQMLLNRDPGLASDYTIRAFAVIDKASRQRFPMITQPVRVRVQGHSFYGMMYAGAEWWTRVSSHKESEVDPDALASDGTLVMTAKDWRDFTMLQAAGHLLRQASSGA